MNRKTKGEFNTRTGCSYSGVVGEEKRETFIRDSIQNINEGTKIFIDGEYVRSDLLHLIKTYDSLKYVYIDT